jgi:hypothetical protein
VQSCLGGPSVEEHEQVVAENKQLQMDLQHAKQEIADLRAKVAGDMSGANCSATTVGGEAAVTS